MQRLQLAIIIVWLAIGVSWIVNLTKLIKCDFQQPYKAEVVRLVGIIPPVAIVTAWVDVGK